MISVTLAADRQEWEAFVDAHPLATAYHLWSWREVFENAFGHDCPYLVARRGTDVCGVLPLVTVDTWLFGRFGVSLPFVNYGGVLAADEESGRALLDGAAAAARLRGLAHVELRHRSRLFPQLPVRQHKVTMLLPLGSSADSMWATLDRKVRNQVRKAEKSGFTVATGGSALLDEFYAVFAENMRDLGTPVYSPRFFESVTAACPERTTVYVVRSGAKPVAAGISLGFRKTLEVPWASSLKAFRSQCPNNLLYWTIIKHAIATGFEIFDFGRSTPDEGTFHFKRQWGAEPHPLNWEYSLRVRENLPDHSPKNPKFRLAIEVWKRLPLPITTLIGPSIVRGIP